MSSAPLQSQICRHLKTTLALRKDNWEMSSEELCFSGYKQPTFWIENLKCIFFVFLLQIQKLMCPLTRFWLLFDMYSNGAFYFVTSPAPGQSSSFYKSHTSNNLVTDENPPLSPQLKSRGEEREREGGNIKLWWRVASQHHNSESSAHISSHIQSINHPLHRVTKIKGGSVLME